MAGNDVSMGRAVLTIAKWAMLAIIGVIVLAGLGIGGGFLYRYVTYDFPASKIVVTVKHDVTTCDKPGRPLLVGFVNNSTRTVLAATFTLGAYLPGYSTNRAKWDSYTEDHIIKPGEGYGRCWPAFLDPSFAPMNPDIDAEIQARRYGVVDWTGENEWRIESVRYRFED